MAYTSEQYKYLLMQRLRKYFSMRNETDRAYTVSFFGKLFDESVTVTEEGYNAFVERMDFEMQYCAEKGYYLCEDLPTSTINEHSLLLIEAFRQIGIELVIDTGDNTATFTKPNGEVMVYSVSTSTNYFYINARTGMELKYACSASPYYRMADKPVLELDTWNPKHAGPNSHWTYDTETQTVTISGSGAAAYSPTEEQVGGGTFSTIVFGANITGIIGKCIPLASVKKIVLLQAADSELATSIASFNYSTNTNYTLDIYTDNTVFKSSTYFPDTWTITWHTLSEWEG
jgi:hypothetical protein